MDFKILWMLLYSWFDGDVYFIKGIDVDIVFNRLGVGTFDWSVVFVINFLVDSGWLSNELLCKVVSIDGKCQRVEEFHGK